MCRSTKTNRFIIMQSKKILPLPFLTRQGLADQTGFCLRTIDALMAAGKIPFFKVGKSIRFSWPDVEAAMKQRFEVASKAAKR